VDFHPIAEIFPMMPEADLNALAADIAGHGLQEPIVTYEGKILDGRNRYVACFMQEIEPEYAAYGGDDPLGYVISLNLHRRHLNESQRAMVAAKMANMPQGARTDLVQICTKSLEQAAEMLSVGRTSVAHARTVLDKGDPLLVEAVRQGQIPVSQGAQIAREEPEVQRAIVETVRNENVKPQEARRRVKAETIRQREAVMPSGKFRVIYADPPWSYGNTQPDYHPEQRDHYAVMSMKEVCALPIKDMAMDNAVLFLWTTSPMLEEAFQVVNAWGFEYKTSFVWDKVKHNMGHYNSVRHELLYVCVRGSCQPDVRKLFDSVVTEERTQHSRKPAIFYDIIETLYTWGPYLELFAREKRDGWEVYGNEV